MRGIRLDLTEHPQRGRRHLNARITSHQGCATVGRQLGLKHRSRSHLQHGAVLLFASCLALNGVRAQSRDTLPIPPAAVDVFHPKYFTRIVEVTVGGSRRVVLGQMDSVWERIDTLRRPSGRHELLIITNSGRWLTQRRVTESVDAEVDVRSRIVIEFDRAWIQRSQLEGDITIRGERQSGSARPEINIAGYAEVGKQRQFAPARVRSTDQVKALAASISSAWLTLRMRLDSLKDQIDRESTHPALVQVRAALMRRDSLFARIRGIQSRMSPLEFALATSRDTANDKNRAALDTLRREYEVQMGGFDAASNDLVSARSAKLYRDAVNSAYVAEARRLVVSSASRLQIAPSLGALIAKDNESGFRTLARCGATDTTATRALIRYVLDSVYQDVAKSFALGETTESVASVQERIESLVVAMNQVVDFLQRGRSDFSRSYSGSVLETPNSLSCDRALMVELRDAEILLSEIGAKSGDVVVLHVADSIPDAGGVRQIDVRLHVREFGFVRRMNDALLFLNRRGVGSDVHDARIDAAIAEFVRTGRADPVQDIPLPVNFIPAPGGAMTWTLYQRSGDRWNSFLRWLTPGAGVNVSFTSFASQTVTFSKADSAGAPPRQTVSVTQDKPQIAAGPVITFFDNAIELSLGWNLNVPQKRAYYAIGFSFMNVAKRLGLSNSSDEASK